MFKSGGSLPSVDAGKENKSKTIVKFQDEQDQDDEESDFDANELLDMTDYKNKRGIPTAAQIAAIKPSLANAKPTAQAASVSLQKTATAAVADEAWELDDDEDEDGWGKDDYEDLKKFDYKNTDLNKMSDF